LLPVEDESLLLQECRGLRPKLLAEKIFFGRGLLLVRKE
jgi:hypothetical protein